VTDRPARPQKRPPELLIRAAVGVGLIVFALAAIILGHWIFWLVIAAMAMIMIAEWADLAGASARDKRGAMLTLVVPLTVMSPAAWGPGWFALGIVGAAAVFVAAVFRSRLLALGMVYVCLPVLALLVIRENREFGLIYTLWTLALVWMCDIGAYFAGRHIGGPKLAPAISPNKTWAGLIGGIALATAFGAFMHWQYGLALRLTLATPFLAAIAQGGDLFESWLKRRAGTKDSGTLFPGHGGVLDRLDGLVPVAPIAAFLVVILPLLYAWRP
jgi:phosphatidate cytidylyltransferase